MEQNGTDGSVALFYTQTAEILQATLGPKTLSQSEILGSRVGCSISVVHL